MKERSLTKGWAGPVEGRSTKLLRRDFYQITDGQVQAVDPSAAVSPVPQIVDDQVRAVSTSPIAQITDGQVQAVTPSAIVTLIPQITDDHVQAASTSPIAQFTDGQILAVTTEPTVSAVHQFTNGEIQAATSIQIVTPVKQNTDSQSQTDVPTSHVKSTALVPHSPITSSSSISSSSNANPGITPSAADPKLGEKAGVGVGAVVGACGIGVLICFLVRLRGNGYGQHDGGGKQEGCAEPQPQHDGLGVLRELACVEMDTLPAMEKIHELPPAEDPPISCATQATSADRSLPYEMGTE